MNDALPPLPEYDPRPDLWARIEADLMRLQAPLVEDVDRIRVDLPTYELRPDLRDSTQMELDNVPVRPIQKMPYPRWLWGGLTTAAILLLVGGWLWFHPRASEHIRIEYTIEHPTHLPTEGTSNPPFVTKRAEAFITRQCAQRSVACQRPEVHELRHQLVELTTQQQRIARERQVFGDDPVLIQAQEKLDHQRVEVLKELISILRS